MPGNPSVETVAPSRTEINFNVLALRERLAMPERQACRASIMRQLFAGCSKSGMACIWTALTLEAVPSSDVFHDCHAGKPLVLLCCLRNELGR